MININSKTFINAFLGKNMEGKEAVVFVPPIMELLTKLITLSNDDWGRYAFAREPLEGKFDDAAKKELIKKANECGIEYAKKYKMQYNCKTPEELAKILDLKINTSENPGGGEYATFAQFTTPNEITIFMDCVNKANQLIEESNLNYIFNGLAIEDVLLAHEIFHYIEQSCKKVIFTKTEKIELWRRPFRYKSEIICLGEIAGMAFAKELLQLDYSPYVFDVMFMYAYNREAAYELFKEVLEII